MIRTDPIAAVELLEQILVLVGQLDLVVVLHDVEEPRGVTLLEEMTFGQLDGFFFLCALFGRGGVRGKNKFGHGFSV